MSDLDPNRLTLIEFLKEFFEKVDFEKSQQTTPKAWKITQHTELTLKAPITTAADDKFCHIHNLK